MAHFDIRDFFPSLHFGRVRGYLIAMGFGYPIATVLAMLMTEAERQPVETDEGVFFVPVGSRFCVQGAPTSPGLANAIFMKVDRRMAGLAKDCRAVYTRYAADLTFSSDDPSGIARLLKVVPLILEEEGFSVNDAKTRIMRANGRQSVTGVGAVRVPSPGVFRPAQPAARQDRLSCDAQPGAGREDSETTHIELGATGDRDQSRLPPPPP